MSNLQNTMDYAGENFIVSLLYESYTNNITAGTVLTQAGATQLVSGINRVTTSTAIGQGVALPPAIAGLDCIVINHSAYPIQVYGVGSDVVNDQLSTVGIPQMQGSVALYLCAANGTWYSEGTGTGYSGGFQTISSTDALTATGSTQGTALAIKTMQNRFTTVAASTGCVLPAAVAGMNIVIINAGANSLQVYGNGSDTINGTAGATGVSLAAGKTAEYFTTVAGAWHQLLSA